MPFTPQPRAVVLVGFMGAGKTTVGQRLAERLGWRFFDIDDEIVRREGMSIGDIFRTRGEPAFRALERQLTDAVCCEAKAVIAPGGGWILTHGALRRLPAGTVTVWLRVSPEEAVRRLGRDSIERPLLAGSDPLERAREILAAREPFYRGARHVIDVDGREPQDITEEIALLVTAQG
jgi:shikimate kinase